MTSSRLVFDSIRQIVRALRVSSRAAEKACGLSTAQLFVLRALRGSRGMSVGELAARTLTHQSSVSVVAKRLASQGLVCRRRSTADSRRVELTLSRSGEARLRKAPALVQERLLATLARFSERDRRTLARLTDRLVTEAGLAEGSRRPPLFFEGGP